MTGLDFGPLVAFSIIGMVTASALAGGAIGTVLAAGFALWFHDLSILLWPSIIGAVAGGAYAIFSLLRPF